MENTSIRANRLDDMKLLARMVRAVAPTDQYKLAAVVFDLDLMRFPWYLQPLVAWVRRRKGRAGLMTYFKTMTTKQPKFVTDFVEQTAVHIESGRDREDRDSVGGLSQREVDVLIRALLSFRITVKTAETSHGH